MGLFDDADELFDRMSRRMTKKMELIEKTFGHRRSQWVVPLPMNFVGRDWYTIHEEDNVVKIELEFPGKDQKDVSVSVRGERILVKTVKGDDEKSATFYVKKLVPDMVTASMKNGLMTILVTFDEPTHPDITDVPVDIKMG